MEVKKVLFRVVTHMTIENQIGIQIIILWVSIFARMYTFEIQVECTATKLGCRKPALPEEDGESMTIVYRIFLNKHVSEITRS